MARLKDVFIGLIFHKLTVVGYPFKRYNRKHYYVNCKCICGKEKEIAVTHLGKANQISCGCYKKEVCKDNSIRKPVICLETGKIFPSCRDGSLNMGLNRDAISTAISANHAAGGYHWKHI